MRGFPVLYQGYRPEEVLRLDGPTVIPWELVNPHERQAKANHGGQNLETLAKRGGLSPAELWFVLRDREWAVGEWPGRDQAVLDLRARVEEWHGAHGSGYGGYGRRAP